MPDGVRHCLKKPGAPKWPYTQRDVASYIVKLSEARDDCAEKLAQVDKLLKLNQSAISEFNAAHKPSR